MTKRRQHLFIIHYKNPTKIDPTSINENLVTTYMNRAIISEEDQFEVIQLLNLSRPSYSAQKLKKNIKTLPYFWGNLIDQLLVVLPRTH